MEWFKSQTSRDQVAIVVGGIALVIYILVGLIYQPIQTRIENLQTSNDTARADLQWMMESASTVKAMQGNSAKTNAGPSGSISQVVDKSVRDAGLKMKRFQPNGDKQAQVWLEGVPYAASIAWLNALENSYGYSLDSVSINASSQSGLINVRVKVNAP
jgi:type II secretory pathway component PulM